MTSCDNCHGTSSRLTDVDVFRFGRIEKAHLCSVCVSAYRDGIAFTELAERAVLDERGVVTADLCLRDPDAPGVDPLDLGRLLLEATEPVEGKVVRVTVRLVREVA